MKENWWKLLAILLIIYSVIFGLTTDVPENLEASYMIYQSIRNLYYHVPMWFTMMASFTIGFVYTIMYLNKSKIEYDFKARAFNEIGIFFGMLGMATGMLWAKYTWGDFWSNDPKQIGAALCLASYAAYFVLRASIKDEQSKAKISGVYSIFAFALMIPFIYIIPDLKQNSLHPGAGNMVSLSDFKGLDINMRRVLYPAALGWILMGVWMANIKSSFTYIKYQANNL